LTKFVDVPLEYVHDVLTAINLDPNLKTSDAAKMLGVTHQRLRNEVLKMIETLGHDFFRDTDVVDDTKATFISPAGKKSACYRLTEVVFINIMLKYNIHFRKHVISEWMAIDIDSDIDDLKYTSVRGWLRRNLDEEISQFEFIQLDAACDKECKKQNVEIREEGGVNLYPSQIIEDCF